MSRAIRALSMGLAFLLCLMLGIPCEAQTRLGEPEAKANIKPFEKSDLKAIEAGQGRRPYWLILWDLDCVYCVHSLKNLAAAQKKDPALLIVTISTDAVEDAPAITARLRDIGIVGQAFVFGNDAPEALRHAIDPAWRGEKPRAYFYDGSGKRQAVSGVLDERRILNR